MVFGPPKRRLLIFDFDETLISVDSISLLRDLLPLYRRPKRPKRAKDGKVTYLNTIFGELRAMGYTSTELRRLVAAIPPVPSIVDFIKHLYESCDPKYDIIIISDSNLIFIKDWLAHNLLSKCFREIFANPSYVVSSDGIRVEPLQNTNCPLGPPNLCKRDILEKYLAKRQGVGVNYERVIFVADGANDYCPTLIMRRDDIVCARKGKDLERKIRCNRQKCKVRPLVLLWSSGHDLLTLLETALDCVAISCI
ncbi:probable phosphatase phospho2 [Ceratitis capitata]|uniref:Putative phosphatase phospho2 n=1 Tax=Ceratitis capitata TaxID=7213 RepID=W8BQ42_CERCA|nr:probable phosphatase phospho2 [Ceratitis capitata]